MKIRVSAVIIENNKILLVSDGSGYFFTPGGNKNKDETSEEALRREVYEEISLDIKKYTQYIEYIGSSSINNIKRKVKCYIINKYAGTIKQDNEIKEVVWFGKNNFESENPPLLGTIKTVLIPNLIKDGLLS